MPLSPDQLTTGQPVILERCVGQLSQKVQSRIIGVQFPTHLLVELPLIKMRPAFNSWDTYCIVRFVKDGTAIGFRSKIASIQMTPFPLAILEYPAETEMVAIRKAERIGCNFPSLVIVDGVSTLVSVGATEQDGSTDQPQGPMHGMIVDLSVGGCQVALPVIEPDRTAGQALASTRQRIASSQKETDYRLEVLGARFVTGKTVALRFEIPQPYQTRFESVASEIRWIRVSDDIMLLGIKFASGESKVAETIGNIIRYYQTYFQSPVSPV